MSAWATTACGPSCAACPRPRGGSLGIDPHTLFVQPVQPESVPAHVAGDEPTKTSTGARATARELMALTPDLKYTEALRMVHKGLTADLRQALSERREKTGPKSVETIMEEQSRATKRRSEVMAAHGAANPKGTLAVGLLGTEETMAFESRVLCDLRRTNLAVSGGVGMGCTRALQGLARDALRQPDWTVRSLDAKCGEYLTLADDLGLEAQSRFEAIWARDSEAFAKAMLETKPGTEKNPLLLVLDGGMPEQFVPFSPEDPAPCTTFGWLSHLLDLMADPNTVVAMRSQMLTALPTEVREACTARLVMGPATSAHYLTAFGQQPSPESVTTIRHLVDGRLTRRLGLLQVEPGTEPVVIRAPFRGVPAKGAPIQDAPGVAVRDEVVLLTGEANKEHREYLDTLLRAARAPHYYTIPERSSAITRAIPWIEVTDADALARRLSSDATPWTAARERSPLGGDDARLAEQVEWVIAADLVSQFPTMRDRSDAGVLGRARQVDPDLLRRTGLNPRSIKQG